MPAYVIGRLNMRDPSWVETYRATVPSLVAKHGGKYLVRGGKMERLEGSDPLPTSYVVLEFPTVAAAKAFHDDPAYAPFIELRQKGSDLEMIVVEGSGRTLLPGLIDAHAHYTFDPTEGSLQAIAARPDAVILETACRHAALALRGGITTARGAGSIRNLEHALRDAIAAGDTPGPRLVAAGTAAMAL